jgi:hypothetical protein
MQYCSNISMSEGSTFRAAVIVALILPGLALAGPVPGPCERCGDGETCHMQQSSRAETDSHICCGSAADEFSTKPSVDASDCECGRDAPLAITAGTSSASEFGAASIPIKQAASLVSSGDSSRARSVRPPAPPPAPPPAYLIDCAFLT